ncbi:MAG TPA: hypothetical protein VIO58_13285 [Candidatus Methanoperedens sp.]
MSYIKTLIGILSIFFIALIILPQTTSAVSENDCLNLTKRALIQLHNNHSDPLFPSDILNWGGNTFREGKVDGKKSIIIGNITFVCKYLPSATASTTPHTDGTILIELNKNDIIRLEDYKAIILHELIHAGVGQKVNRLAIPEVLQQYSRSCDETLAHSKNLFLLQDLNGSQEFAGIDLTRSFAYQRSMKFLERNLKDCIGVTAKSDNDLDKEMRDGNVRWDQQERGKEEYKKLIELLRKEIEKVKLRIMEKKILHMRSNDRKISRDENRTLEIIRSWLNVSITDYNGLYNEIAMADLSSRLHGTRIPDKASDFVSEGVSLAVSTLPGDRIKLDVSSENGLLMVRQHIPTENKVETDEETLTGILNSLDKEEAVKMALASGKISIDGKSAPFIDSYSRILRLQYYVSPPFSPGKKIKVGRNEILLERSAHGLTLARLPDMEYTLHLDRFGGIAGCTNLGDMRLAEYKPDQLTRSAGIYIPEWDAITHRNILEGSSQQTLECRGNTHAYSEAGVIQ